MTSQDALYYRALRTRDARFDERFFTGVTSTGIYCRPVCPARTPRASNCVFFACAAAAEAQGFRACRRCRPEASPGTPAWLGTSATIARALRMIEDGALESACLPELAARLGVGDRHLRRLFVAELGAPPLAVAQTRRAHFAKRLLETSTLSMTDVAMASGFKNVRGFNRAIRASFDATPQTLRRAASRGQQSPEGQVELRLGYRAPFDWPGLLRFIAPRAIPGVEVVHDGVYRRTVGLPGFVGRISVRCSATLPELRLSAPVAAAPVLGHLAAQARHLFDLQADPATIFGQLMEAPELVAAARRNPGARVPGAWDRFEVAVRAVLGQQVSVVGATTLAGRLVERFGEAIGGDAPGLSHVFPPPEVLRDASLEPIGLPKARAQTIRDLAAAVAERPELLALGSDLETSIAQLRAVKGIGDWTAQYIAMRALHEPDAFPSGDLGLRKALGQEGTPASARQAAAYSAAWRPWRAYAAIVLWRDGVTKGTS